MEREDKQQPLTDGALMEYIVHGEFAYKKSDINGTFGAWWVPLRKMVKELGKEVVEEKLEELDNEMRSAHRQPWACDRGRSLGVLHRSHSSSCLHFIASRRFRELLTLFC